MRLAHAMRERFKYVIGFEDGDNFDPIFLVATSLDPNRAHLLSDLAIRKAEKCSIAMVY
jgi:hypothetical protein